MARRGKTVETSAIVIPHCLLLLAAFLRHCTSRPDELSVRLVRDKRLCLPAAEPLTSDDTAPCS